MDKTYPGMAAARRRRQSSSSSLFTRLMGRREGRSDGRRTQFPLRCIFLSHFSRDRRQVGDRSSYKITETNALQHSMKIKAQQRLRDFNFYSILRRKTKHFPHMGAVSLPPIQRKDGCSKERVSLKKLTLSSYLGIRAVLELP